MNSKTKKKEYLTTNTIVAKLLSLIVDSLKSQNSSSSRTWLSVYANKCFKLCPRANNESATVAVCGASVSYKMCQPFALCGCPNNFRPLTPALPPAAAPNSHYTSNHGPSVSVLFLNSETLLSYQLVILVQM